MRALLAVSLFSSFLATSTLFAQLAQDPFSLDVPELPPGLHACVDSMKQKFLNRRPVIDLPETKLDDDAGEWNKFLSKPPQETFYLRGRTTSGDTHLLATVYVMEGKDQSEKYYFYYALELNYIPTLRVHNLALHFSASLIRNQEFVRSLDQMMDIQPGCAPYPKRVIVDKAEKEAGQVVMSRDEERADGPKENPKIKLPADGARRYWDLYRLMVGDLAAAGKFRAFLDFDGPVFDAEAIMLPSGLKQKDLFTNQTEDFRVEQVSLSQNNKPAIQIVVERSTKSPYSRQTKHLLSTGEDRMTETIPLEMWKKEKLHSLQPVSYARVEDLVEGDFSQPSLSMEILASRESEFPTSPYGELVKKASEGQFPRYEFMSTSGRGLPDPELVKDPQQYVKESHYYDYTKPSLQKLLALVDKKNPQNKEETLKAIREVLNENFKGEPLMFQFPSLNSQLTASESAERQSGVCQHFSKIFVAMARAKGIPSRVILGLHLEPGKASVHAWVEVSLDNRTWMPIEPWTLLAHNVKNGFYLDDRHYFPLEAVKEYERPVGADTDVTKVAKSLKLRFKKSK